jgi:hypothetical protein
MIQEGTAMKLRTSPIGYYLLGGISGAVAILSGTVAATKAPSLIVPALISGAIFLFFIVWMSAICLELTETSIKYRSLWSSMSVSLNDVEDIKLSAEFNKNKPFQRIVISTYRPSKGRQIVINAALLDAHLTRQWVEVVKTRLLPKTP